MSKVGKSEIRVDAFDKVTGRTKYYEDRMPAGALYARIKHSTIAHGFVKSVDKSAAEAIPGVVKVLTCFDVPEHCFPTAGPSLVDGPGASGRGRPQSFELPCALLRRRRRGRHCGG